MDKPAGKQVALGWVTSLAFPNLPLMLAPLEHGQRREASARGPYPRSPPSWAASRTLTLHPHPAQNNLRFSRVKPLLGQLGHGIRGLQRQGHMSEMGFTCDRVTLHWCQHPELPALNAFGRKGGPPPPRSKLDGFENEDNRMPVPPQDDTSFRSSRGRCPHQPADTWPFGEPWGLRGGTSHNGILERVNIKN